VKLYKFFFSTILLLLTGIMSHAFKLNDTIPAISNKEISTQYNDFFAFMQEKYGADSARRISASILSVMSPVMNFDHELKDAIFEVKRITGKDTYTSLYKNVVDVRLNEVAAGYLQFTPDGFSSLTHHVDGNMYLWNIPFSLNVFQFSNVFEKNKNSVLKNFQFDRHEYMRRLKSNLTGSKSLLDHLKNKNEIFSYVKEYYQHTLVKRIKSVRFNALENADQLIDNSFSIEEYLTFNDQQINDRILKNANIAVIQNEVINKKKYLSDHQSDLNSSVSDSLLNEIKISENKINDINRLSLIVVQTKKDLDKSISINKIFSGQSKYADFLSGSLNQPENIKNAAEQLLPMNGIQRFFTMVNNFKAGDISEEDYTGTIQGFFSNAVNLSVSKSDHRFSFGGGALNDSYGLSNLAETANQHLPSGNMQFFSYSKFADDERNRFTVTVMNANIKDAYSQLFNHSAVAKRNNMVGTLEKNFPVNAAGIINVELSTSANQFANETDHLSGNAQKNIALSQIGVDVFNTLSSKVSYSDYSPKYKLAPRVQVGYTGQGYYNALAGNNTRGSVFYDLGFRKDFNRNKGIFNIQYRNNYYNTSADSRFDYMNSAFNSNFQYRYSKNMRWGGGYHRSAINTLREGKSSLYNINRYSVNMNNNFYFKEFFINQNINVNYQNIRFDRFTDSVNSNLLLLNYNVSAPVGSNNASLFISYNKELGDMIYINNLFISELSYQYTVKKRFTAGSSLNYNNDIGIVKQLGIRQALSFLNASKISFDISVDYKHDLIENLNKYLYPNFRGNVSISYKF
jgi:hypothetical protein